LIGQFSNIVLFYKVVRDAVLTFAKYSFCFIYLLLKKPHHISAFSRDTNTNPVAIHFMIGSYAHAGGTLVLLAGGVKDFPGDLKWLWS